MLKKMEVKIKFTFTHEKIQNGYTPILYDTLFLNLNGCL